MPPVFFIPYNNVYKSKVFPSLIPWNYYNRYTKSSTYYKILSFVGIYRTYLYLLIKENSKVIGSIAFRYRLNINSFSIECFIYGVAIKEKYRGKGYGNKIMNESIKWCQGKNINRIFLKVEADNHSAINLYKKFGFRVINEKALKNQLIMLKKF